ncbi:DUF4112 domain-containing protein [Sphingobacteriaceae bacterium WQ 2009]|uniref:DUF4112 domain-containing protein n=1 Tax=Rhinopithecimicrobium faecis TaxID=2820698 RepID=A0A8T4HFP8_9SPHI|nr:DUF4112 domain-containing protein [Sphingobacteriaceae bacterium WQ 2009]
MKNIQRNQAQLKQDFAWIERISWLLDNKFQLPGTSFRFGLDPLLNLIPFAGKAVSFVTSLVMILIMWRHGVSRKAILLMLINILIDAITGAIPLFGNIFDFFHKANQKNMVLLREYYFEERHQGKGNGILLAMAISLLLLCAAMIYLLWMISSWIWGFIT